MVPQPVEGSEVLGQVRRFLYFVDGGALRPLRSAAARENIALFLPLRRPSGGVAVTLFPSLLFGLKKCKLLFQDGPDRGAYGNGCVLAALRVVLR